MARKRTNNSDGRLNVDAGIDDELTRDTDDDSGTVNDTGSGRGDGIPVVDPTELSGTDSSGDSGSGDSAPKRRGRKPGQRNSKKETSDSLVGLNEILLSLHMMGAVMLQLPELALDADESKKLAAAIEAVQKHYPILIQPKTFAIMQLAFVAGTIYIPRGIAIYNRPRVARIAATKPTLIRPQTNGADSVLTNPSQLDNRPPVL